MTASVGIVLLLEWTQSVPKQNNPVQKAASKEQATWQSSTIFNRPSLDASHILHTLPPHVQCAPMLLTGKPTSKRSQSCPPHTILASPLHCGNPITQAMCPSFRREVRSGECSQASQQRRNHQLLTESIENGIPTTLHRGATSTDPDVTCCSRGQPTSSRKLLRQ